MKHSTKELFDKRYRYSIRRLSVGAASVAVGCLLFGSPLVGAQSLDGAEATTTQPTTVEEGESVAPSPVVAETVVETPRTPEVPAQPAAESNEVAASPVQPSALSETPANQPQDKEVDQASSTETWRKVNHITETDQSLNFDQDWKFHLGDATGAETDAFDDSSWKDLNLPHDFSLTQDYSRSGEAESGYKPGGVGWYRKEFTVSDAVAKGRVELQFDGAYMETEVFINGTSLGVHPYGYTPFTFDLTKHLRVNEANLLAVKVTNPVPSSRWYSGSGIYRSVHLNTQPQTHIEEYGVVVATPTLENTYKQDGSADVQVTTKIVRHGAEAGAVKVVTSIFERRSDGSLSEKALVSKEVDAGSLAANETRSVDSQLKLAGVKLWTLDNPNLYVIRTEVYQDGVKVQSRDQETGFRYIRYDKDKGFSLNGQLLKLQGVCLHHDQGGLGAQAYYDAIERQFDILKEMGVNAVRVTHNPASRVMKDIANRKGMLLIDEAFDTWEHAKNSNTQDYARYFNRKLGEVATHLVGAKDANQTWAEYHIKQMVRSGVNDPAIIMWSTGNEVLEGISSHATNYGSVIANLIKWIKEIDGSRPATIGDNKLKNGNSVSIAMGNKLKDNQGIVGFNYADGSQYDSARSAHPDWIIYGSETASSINSRGVYDVKGNRDRADKQLTSYDQRKVNWGHYASQAWYDVITRDFVAGEFVWTGFDYLGEPTPWNGVGSGTPHGWPAPKSSYFGIVDTAGFPKDSYYFYRSQWNKKDITLHVLPAWKENVVAKDANGNVEVVVYSNAHKVKLVHTATNGEVTEYDAKAFTTEKTAAGYSYQIYRGADKSGTEHQNLYLTWRIPYKDGTIKAIAYDEQGNVIEKTVGTKELSTFGEASKLTSKVSKKPTKADDHSLAYIEIDVQDANGNLVINADKTVHVTVSGPAELVAMDNGNPMDHQSYQDGNRKVFGGKVLAIVKLTGKAGTVSVTAKADGLAATTQTFAVESKEVNQEKTPIAYKLPKNIYIKRGAKLSLPTEVLIRYSDDSEETRGVTFDEAVHEQLKTEMAVKAKGRVTGLNMDVSILVSVLDQVAAIQNVATAVEKGNRPTLPTTVQAYLANGQLLSTQFPVTWTMPEAARFNQVGTVIVEGMARVLGSTLPVTATVRVGDKELALGANVASKATTIAQDIPANQQSDTLEAIKDGSLTVSANVNGGKNPTIWSNYDAAQAGKTHATLSFTYDTAQNIGEVTIYYHRDSYSLRLPKSVAFSWSRSTTGEAQVIAHTVAGTETSGSLTKVTYRLANPIPAEVFKVTVENSDEVLNGRKPSVGIAELELKTALERFEKSSEASINEIRIGEQVLTGSDITKNMTVSGKGDVRARHTRSNVATTILQTAPDTVKIFTRSEDGSRSETYTLTFVADSPTTEGRNYISRREVTLSAGSTQSGADNAVTNANDFNLQSIWHSAWSGAPLDQLWLTADTGRVRQLNGLAYIGRRDNNPNGQVTDYEVYVSTDNQNWKRVHVGRFEANNLDWQEASFAPTQGRYLRLKALHTLGDAGRLDRFMSASEFRVSEFLGTVETLSLEGATVSLPSQPIRYTGQAQTPKATVQLANTLLTEGIDYTLSYSNNIGKASQDTEAVVIVMGTGRYTGQIRKTFTILAFTGAATTDGTTETAERFTASAPATAEAIRKAKTDAAYLGKEYKVLPVPHSVTYGTGVVALEGTVNLLFGEGLDIYTRNRLKDTLQAQQISYKTGHQAEQGVTNIYVGIKGRGSQAEAHQANAGITQGLYDKTDAYSLWIKDGVISIVGKDTDAAFYGLTTLKHLLKDSPVPVLREVKVEDYADVKNRGFIEGYYGNPWSNEDRMELMRYGGDLKLTQYFFAPKDDPFHNSRWRELYPEEKLAEIREMARVGNQSKTRYVWTLHPFMHNRVRFANQSHYQEDLGVIKAKFEQLMQAGVREFGILADDAPTPAGGYESYNRLMADLTDWLESKQGEYLGLRKEMVFVPHEYWGDGDEAELRSLNERLPESSILTLTGGRIWGEVSTHFLNRLKNNLSAGNKTYRPVQLWINWPCTDNSKEHLILGGGEKFLHPNVDPSLIGGIMLNPMQQSEPSKIALFSAAAYTWNIWKSEAEARQINDTAFAFAETGRFTDTAESIAFRELGKHMINQNMDGRVVKLEESLELAPKLANFKTKLEAGEDTAAERALLRAEFAKLKAAAMTYKASGHERMREQIKYWLDNTIDQMTALESLLTATEYIGKDAAKVWENYHKGLTAYEASKTHTFWYVNHYEKAELGVQHIRPFVLYLLEKLATEVEKEVYPDKLRLHFISNREGAEGQLEHLLDGDLSTQMIFKNPASIATGDYIGLSFDKPIKLNQLGFAMGAVTNLHDTFTSARLEYLNEEDQWVALEGHQFVGNEPLIQLDKLNIMAKAVRLIATSNRDNTWLGIREIAINRPLETKRQTPIAITHSTNLIYKNRTTEALMKDRNDATEAMFADATGRDSTPVGAWIQADLGEVKAVSRLRLAQGTGDKLAAGVLEYSADGTTWTTLSSLTGEQVKEVTDVFEARYIRVRNTKAIPLWWRIKEFTVETSEGTSELTDTNVASLANTKALLRMGRYDLPLAPTHRLAPNEYVGLKLDRLYELQAITAEGSKVNVLYSPNAVEWYSLDQLASQPLGRYIRLVNTGATEQEIGASHLLVTKKEIQPDRLKSTTMGISSAYGANDVRRINNLGQLFDEDYTNFVEFADTPKQGGEIVLELGVPRPIHKLRAYVQDGTQNYLRDGKLQVSEDGLTWTDIVTIGDGQANANRDDSLSDGWVHDANRPGNRYIEGSLDTPVHTRYLRVYFTANYDHRFVGFTELVINDGEFVPTISQPAITGNGKESRTSLKSHLIDGRLLSTYRPTEESGHLLYHLSEKTTNNHIKLVSDLKAGTKGSVYARVVEEQPAAHAKEVASKWVKLGDITSSLQTFALSPASKHLLDVKVEWAGGSATFYELATYWAELAEVFSTVPAEGIKDLAPEKPIAQIVEEDVPYETIERMNPDLASGSRRVVQEGKKGRKQVFIEIQLVDGKETGRTVLETHLLDEPMAQIVEVGSKRTIDKKVGQAHSLGKLTHTPSTPSKQTLPETGDSSASLYLTLGLTTLTLLGLAAQKRKEETR